MLPVSEKMSLGTEILRKIVLGNVAVITCISSGRDHREHRVAGQRNANAVASKPDPSPLRSVTYEVPITRSRDAAGDDCRSK